MLYPSELPGLSNKSTRYAIYVFFLVQFNPCLSHCCSVSLIMALFVIGLHFGLQSHGHDSTQRSGLASYYTPQRA